MRWIIAFEGASEYNLATMNDNDSAIQVIPVSDEPRVSVVIPHFYTQRKAQLDSLIAALKAQTFKSLEIIVVSEVSPQGRAINQGFRVAKGEILVIFDDDASMDQPQVVENLVRTLDENPDIGMAGASIISPDSLNDFQRKAAEQFPRFCMPVVSEVTESDLACHGCVAFPRKVFEAVGMEREDILRGLDPDLRVRVRQAGYKVVLVPKTWVYHPLPETLGKFVKTFYRNGAGSAYTQIHQPELSYDTDEETSSESFVAKRPLIYRIFRFPLRLLKSLLTGQWIRLLAYSVYLVGYLVGSVKYRVSSPIK